MVLFVLATNYCEGQGGWWRRGRNGPIVFTEGGEEVNENTVKTAREIAPHSTAPPIWTNPKGFEEDTFTFARIIRDRDPNGPYSAGSWITDFPDSDLNLSYRLHELTSILVNPDGRTLRLTNPNLFNYPFIYMVEPGSLSLRDEEVLILRKYLQSGGVLMVDDFWGEWQWSAFAAQMKRVFPEKDFIELPMEHPIFHCVFDLQVPKNKLQTPSYHWGIRSEYTGVTWETHPREDGSREACKEMHVRAILDNKNQIMVIATHNCDNGDGWEREGENPYFFHEFSEKRAYPLGINILFYIMTH